MLPRLLALIVWFLPLLCRGFDTTYWIWNRPGGYPAQITQGLAPQGVKKLYYYAGELENTGAEWSWKIPLQRQKPMDGITLVPVVRISSVGKTPFTDASFANLLEKLKTAVAAVPENHALQIDFDCPDRLLGDYAQALGKIHAVIPQLSITALVGWCKSPEWDRLQSSVDELFPMFYDTAPDTGSPLPLLDGKKAAAQIEGWRGCRIPWRAGLPTFTRITLLDAQGHSRGTVRNWDWNDICFNKCLSAAEFPNGGVAVLHVEKDGLVSETPVKHGETLVVRWPPRDAMASALEAAKGADATGVAWFRLPDDTSPSGWSLAQIGHLEADTAPHLVLREKTPGHLVLANESASDLEPALSGSRGYALEIDAPGPVFREASAGDFWKITGFTDPEGKPALVAIPFATRLTFWFSHLRAGESLGCGLIQLAPGASLKQIRYRILPEKTWHSIE